MLYGELSYNDGVALLRTETEKLTKMGIDFSCYDIRVPNYIVLFSKKEIPALKDLGYEEMTEEEREEQGLNMYEKYRKKKAYKISIESLLKRTNM